MKHVKQITVAKAQDDGTDPSAILQQIFDFVLQMLEATGKNKG